MNYLTQKNERRHRRNAKLLTALITLTIFVAFAYYSGLLNEFILEWTGPTASPAAPSPVASV